MSTSKPTDIALSDGREEGFSVLAISGASYSWLFSNLRNIAKVMRLPILAAATILVLMFKAYFSMLARYLGGPSGQTASLTVGVAIGLALVWLFLNAVASARLACLLYGEKTGTPPVALRRAVGARLYAAMLRLLLLVVLCLAAEAAAAAMVSKIMPTRFEGALNVASWAAALLIVVVISVRGGLLQPALALYQGQGVLRRSWQMTRGRLGQFLFLWVALWALPWALLQSMGEFLMQPIFYGMTGSNPTIVGAAQGLATNNLAILSIAGTVALSSTAALVLATIGSCLAYDALASQKVA